MKVILVCGGRDYANDDWVFRALDSYQRAYRAILVVQGGANGADHAARNWAASRGSVYVTFHAPWKGLGKAAGPARNVAMLAYCKPDIVAAFPGGKGTADMVARATAASIRVDQWPRPTEPEFP